MAAAMYRCTLNKVRALVSYRAKVLRNQVRTQRMLDLVTLHLRGADQLDSYTRRIRAALEAQQGAGPKQRVGVTGGPVLH
jgi:hypothetical protein